ncbi:MAG TPA: tetratricopeptide repeat protein [Gemmatimonadota bacterium]|jgi:tetratricopeptide (TPR) repeat protein
MTRAGILPLATLALVLGAGRGPAPVLADGGATPSDSLYEEAGRLYATERYVEAIPLFERVLSENPRFANAYALLGGSFLHLGIYERAIENFEKALRFDEGIKLAYLGLITANYYTSRLDVAQKWARKCLPVLSPGEKDRWISFLDRKFPGLEIGPGGVRPASRTG